MAGGATPTSSAGHASAGANTTSKLTFKSDHQSGAGQPAEPFETTAGWLTPQAVSEQSQIPSLILSLLASSRQRQPINFFIRMDSMIRTSALTIRPIPMFGASTNGTASSSNSLQ